MGKLAKVIAFLFRLLNFFFDCLQTWQYTGGGGMGVVIAGFISWWQGLSMWGIAIVALLAGILVPTVIAVVLRLTIGRNIGSYEKRKLRRLPKLAYDIHKRTSAVREKFVNHIDWSKVDTSKVLTPVLDVFTTEKESVVVDDEKVTDVSTRLDEAGNLMHGASSVLDTLMKDSDTSLVKKLESDFWYRVLRTRIEEYKPYPSEQIRKDVEAVIDGSLTFNNVIVLQLYASPDSLSLKSLSTFTQLSDVKKRQVSLVNANTIKIMNDTIDKASTRLEEHVNEFIREGK